MKLTCCNGVLYVLNQDLLHSETFTPSAVNRFKKDDEKARPRVVLNVEKELATLIITLGL